MSVIAAVGTGPASTCSDRRRRCGGLFAAHGQRWCKALKPRIDGSIPTADAARFWAACAEQGIAASLDTSAQDAHRAIALYRDAHDPVGEFLGWHLLLYATLLAHRFDEACRALAEAKRLVDPSWPPRLRAGYHNVAGLYFDNIGQSKEAREHYVAYLELSRQTRSDADELIALSLLADLEVAGGHPERAVEMLREPASRVRASTTEHGNSMSVRNYATALMESGQLEEAESAFRVALPLVKRGFGHGAFVLHDAASLLAWRGRIDDAARVFAYAESVYAAMGRKPRRVALRNRERLLALLAAERSADALSQLYDEGRRLTDSQACALAFAPSPSA